jgi:LysR family glycine cleavage system transcriptional activator
MPAKPSSRRLPPLSWLRAFECAARHMSFTDAAEELGVTQAAVSQQLRQLEEWLGAQLFKRLPRGLALTDAGIAYLPTVRDSFDRLNSGTEQIFGRLGSRPVTLRATATMAALWLGPLLAKFRQAHPKIFVRVTTLYAPVDFGQDGVDIEIRYGNGQWPGVTSYKLFDETYFPAASPAYLAAAAKVKKPADLIGHKLVHVLGVREGWGEYFRQAGIAEPPAADGVQCDSLVVALQCAAAGAGLVLATSPVADALIAAKVLVPVLNARVPARLAHYLVIPNAGAQAGEIATVADWLVAQKKAKAKASKG